MAPIHTMYFSDRDGNLTYDGETRLEFGMDGIATRDSRLGGRSWRHTTDDGADSELDHCDAAVFSFPLYGFTSFPPVTRTLAVVISRSLHAARDLSDLCTNRRARSCMCSSLITPARGLYRYSSRPWLSFCYFILQQIHFVIYSLIGSPGSPRWN
jgi:hypothetical protein